MKYKQLGGTGLMVSEFCLGTMTFGGKNDPMSSVMGALDEQAAGQLVNEALEAGINFFDTANVYGVGESEEILGRSLKGKRHEAVIATKVRFRMGPGPNQVGLSRGHIIQQAEESLKRLGTDYIDLYQIHGPDPLTDWEETLRALDDLVRSGKVRYIGCSNLQGWQMMKANGISRELGLHTFQTTQSYYSLAGRDIERDIIPVLQDQKVGLLVWSPLAGGFLSGKYTRDNQGGADDRRNKFDFPPVDREKGYGLIDVLQEIAKARETSVARIALAWLLNQPAVTSVIVGAKRPDQLQDNLGASGIILNEEELSRLDQVSRLQPEYPLWNPSVYIEDRYPIQK
ncbi:Predicted oxidoreductase [Paenibacillus sophorae]|uniref:Aldo/keto reductase n=1 Tax=Paenibacillus sophorae TaxID=1333845 RepID=A0A1H8SUZ4_9BACL|nr:aldo/keto reductase [Paenibacillus sophorae]QWU15564.1 aldo/keto reductase [Paenibacillus sophorae]SEO82144.1 Predicted oxidoreductase [Paenibacillus sophorae]